MTVEHAREQQLMGFNVSETELNPHKAVEAASRARTDQTGLPSSGHSPPAHGCRLMAARFKRHTQLAS